MRHPVPFALALPAAWLAAGALACGAGPPAPLEALVRRDACELRTESWGSWHLPDSWRSVEHEGPWHAQMRQARSAVEAGNLAKAESYYLVARESGRGCLGAPGPEVEALAGLGDAYARLGMPERALVTYREAAELGEAAPGHPRGWGIEPRLRLARLRAERGDPDAAREEYERAFALVVGLVEEFPNDLRSREKLAPVADEYWGLLVSQGLLEEAGGVALRRERALRIVEQDREHRLRELERSRPLPP